MFHEMPPEYSSLFESEIIKTLTVKEIFLNDLLEDNENGIYYLAGNNNYFQFKKINGIYQCLSPKTNYKNGLIDFIKEEKDYCLGIIPLTENVLSELEKEEMILKSLVEIMTIKPGHLKIDNNMAFVPLPEYFF